MEPLTLPPVDPLLVLRILCGVWFVPHCIGKIRNVDAAALNSFAKAGFPRPHLIVIVTILIEILAATGLIFGVFEKLAALLAVGVLAGASYAVVKIYGFHWRWQKMGPEYMIFWAVAVVISVWR